ncbi:endonuclease/exonuclease/phosphatase family protein [Demequina mangrovi]|uniref:Uncharacterized conserved protein YafD, endonuclease/exonuclease/phosphatase (EEP) superfamily n=1 Tax=Demequina mangrovi TaxID=1043493 RepID=A0A1H6WHY1_9MICO|nr:endonuclease/exonuclease/phosphatase family protein [Demequina mangrovi]SEJ14814.1 Uncharacterized conserved protein YafD, endonuclease/exonuclease/phosphatase (EEP) superfamily [Demequina mangrovi]
MGEQGEAARTRAHAAPVVTVVGVLTLISRSIAWVVLVVILIPVLVRLTGWELGPLAIVVSAMPWVTLLALVPVACAAAARAWALLAAAVATLALCVVWIAPLYVATTATGEPELRVATLSLASGGADSEGAVAMVRTHVVDVLVLTELTELGLAALQRAGLGDDLPYSWSSIPADNPERKAGTGLWSRVPLVDPVLLPGFSAATIRAQLTTSVGALTVIAVHPESPNALEHAQWRADLERLHDVLEEQEGPVLVAGDFNATRDHRLLRDIADLGYVDAADQAGAGFIPTFPRGGVAPGVPAVRRILSSPLVAIDHVMVRDAGLVATNVEGVEISRADHRGLVVEYSGG